MIARARTVVLVAAIVLSDLAYALGLESRELDRRIAAAARRR